MKVVDRRSGKTISPPSTGTGIRDAKDRVLQGALIATGAQGGCTSPIVTVVCLPEDGEIETTDKCSERAGAAREQVKRRALLTG